MRKKQTKKNVIYSMLLASLVMITTIVSCGEEEETPVISSDPEVSKFSPVEGRIGARVTIIGKNFTSDMEATNVSFNGTEAEVISTSESVIVAKVPVGATSGTISVSIFGTSVNSEQNFTVSTSHSISEISPNIGEAGDQVTIIGSNFGDAAEDVSVKFSTVDGDVNAVVLSATPSELVVVVPDGASTGPIKVQVGPEVIQSSFDFTFPFFGLNSEFMEDEEGWTSESSLSVSDGVLSVDFGGSNSSSLTYNQDVFFNPTKFPILAIRMTRLADFDLILNTTLGTFGDGANEYKGIIDGDIYFYDLREGDYLTTETLINTVEFQITKNSNETSYDVKWIRSFESIASVQSYDPFPEGKFIWQFDNTPERSGLEYDMLPAQDAEFTVEDGQLKVNFAQTSGRRRADLYRVFANTFPSPTTTTLDDPRLNIEGDPNHPNYRENVVITRDYPIFAVKFGDRDRLPVGSEGGQIIGRFNRNFSTPGVDVLDDGGGTNKSEKAADRLYYWNNFDPTRDDADAVPEGQNSASYKIFQIKMADYNPDLIPESDLTGYDIDWVGTFESVEAMEAYNARY